MPAITIKNIPDNLYKQIKKSAAQNYRSINGEVLYRLQNSLSEKQADPEELIKKIADYRNKLKTPVLTDEFLKMAKNQGRP